MVAAFVWTTPSQIDRTPRHQVNTWDTDADAAETPTAAVMTATTTVTATATAVTVIAAATVIVTGTAILTRVAAATIGMIETGTTTGIETTTDGTGTGVIAVARRDATHRTTGGAEATPEAHPEAAARRVLGTMKLLLQVRCPPMGLNRVGEELRMVRKISGLICAYVCDV